jgi:hypothetical protein
MNPSHTLTVRRLDAIEKALKARAMTAAELAGAVHIGHVAMLRYIRELMALGQIRIERWKRSGVRHWCACYRWGKGENAPKPAPITNKIAQRAYRERIRKDPLANELFLARNRARDRAQSATKKPQQWFSALM